MILVRGKSWNVSGLRTFLAPAGEIYRQWMCQATLCGHTPTSGRKNLIASHQCSKCSSVRNPFPLDNGHANNQKDGGDVDPIDIGL